MAVLVLSCNNNTSQKSQTVNENVVVDSNSTIIVNPLTHAKDFPDATLNISAIHSEKVGSDSAKITFEYSVDNFKLTEQTEHSHHMANSHDGQHIHFILDNQAYTALYEPKHSVTVPINTEHYLLSFLSRSFHESLKSSNASKLIKFKVDADGNVKNEGEPKDAGIFYSRPKGEYKGQEGKSILLDFYLANVTLGTEDNKVKANINGQEFTLDKWIPYEILNLPLGENSIKLSIVDKDGNALTGDNVSVERTFKITP